MPRREYNKMKRLQKFKEKIRLGIALLSISLAHIQKQRAFAWN